MYIFRTNPCDARVCRVEIFIKSRLKFSNFTNSKICFTVSFLCDNRTEKKYFWTSSKNDTVKQKFSTISKNCYVFSTSSKTPLLPCFCHTMYDKFDTQLCVEKTRQQRDFVNSLRIRDEFVDDGVAVNPWWIHEKPFTARVFSLREKL